MFSGKKIIILLVILLIFSYQKITSTQGSWERLNSPTNKNLNALCFVDSLYGWAAGESGIIIHTSDGGSNWIFQNSTTENNVLDIFFLNRNLGWAVTWQVTNFPFGTSLLKTTNGGQNWLSLPNIVESCFAQSIFFLDSINGWMGGKPYPIVRTTDGGDNWEESVIDSSTYSTYPVYDIKFFNSKFGYASGGVFDCCGIMWWTTNGGNFWFVADTPNIGPEPIYQIHIFDSLNVIGVGGDFEPWGFGVATMRTSDGGGIWDFEYIGISGVAWDIDFRTSREVWACLRGNSNFIYSSDSGMSWAQVPPPDSAHIFNITFPDSLHGFGVGLDGAIVKYKPVINRLNTENNFIPEGFLLKQNYPNPFNSGTLIKWQSPIGSWQKIRVFDVLGGEIITLVNEYMSAGNHEVYFNGGELPSGVYFYVLTAPGFLGSKKMILLR